MLKQVEEGTSVEEICRKAGIAEATFYNWRKKYGGLMPSELKPVLRLLEQADCIRLVEPQIGLQGGRPSLNIWSIRHC